MSAAMEVLRCFTRGNVRGRHYPNGGASGWRPRKAGGETGHLAASRRLSSGGSELGPSLSAKPSLASRRSLSQRQSLTLSLSAEAALMRSDDRRLIFEGVFLYAHLWIFFFFLQSDGKEKKAWRRSQAAKWEGKLGVCNLAANTVKCCLCACLFPRERNVSSDPAPSF